ncbi:MAG: hypothetical protein COB04_05155 [Gammaproteobacteria bacterium]|nr:MAG: hypothetical protein COB04_06825 [Gammaproteobacteria bacterium]PCJ19697.1 MAG: hypothetical protein COB04_05155 [Gammaproteobacteria bacterium]
MSTVEESCKGENRSKNMLRIEKALFWLCHLAMAASAATVIFREYFEAEYLSTQIFASGFVLYTFTLGLSIFFDKIDSSRIANDEEARSLGSVFKPILLACLVVVLLLSGLVVVINVLVERAGIHF